MIAVKLQGRLGNQLFQYAFIYATAKNLNTSFYLDKSIDVLLIDKYFDIEKDYFAGFDKYLFNIRGFKNLFNYHFRVHFYRFVESFFRLKSKNFSDDGVPALQKQEIENKTIYCGFFQSEEYFAGYETEIRKIFKIKKCINEEFEKLIVDNNIPSSYIVVHIRRGDYLNYNWLLPFSYFHAAIKSIHKEENFYVFISDAPEIISKEFDYITEKYVSENNEGIDFQFITNADVCILSNSTFSWWGAWLNYRNATIVAPRFWLGQEQTHEYPPNIIPETWVQI